MRRCLVRAMYLGASAVAVSTWGAMSSARPLPFTFIGKAAVKILQFCLLCVKLNMTGVCENMTKISKCNSNFFTGMLQYKCISVGIDLKELGVNC